MGKNLNTLCGAVEAQRSVDQNHSQRYTRVAQWLAYRSSKPGVVVSSTTVGIKTIKGLK